MNSGGVKQGRAIYRRCGVAYWSLCNCLLYVAPPSYGLGGGKALDWGVRSLSEILSRQFPGGLKSSTKMSPKIVMCYDRDLNLMSPLHESFLLLMALASDFLHFKQSRYSCRKPESLETSFLDCLWHLPVYVSRSVRMYKAFVSVRTYACRTRSKHWRRPQEVLLTFWPLMSTIVDVPHR